MTTDTATPRPWRRLQTVAPETHSASKIVATYDDYRRALAAVEELERAGAPPGLHVALSGFDDVRVRPENDLLHETQKAVGPALAGAVAFLGATWLAGGVLISGPLPLVLATAAVAAILAAVAVGAFRGLRLDVPMPTTRRVPTRYEVRCDAGAAAPTAERHFAGWWATGLDGPATTPAGRRVATG